ncbi:hypothetical protein DI005_33340 [Prauserella sp. PE36]|uniref:hypothetical protein n=1 Tax=Prauserella sp. PE36 TaxID=1504709 RepID=UPI000D934C6C|nr:hypothetical protein [Prauserella sp. PE36]PXY29944.1 hypothetical protein BAY59_11900 [Prauserella coralliicola]RBM11532.1 hypothetical protein DI005_33340 [Prauserella sp. PE36]
MSAAQRQQFAGAVVVWSGFLRVQPRRTEPDRGPAIAAVAFPAPAPVAVVTYRSFACWIAIPLAVRPVRRLRSRPVIASREISGSAPMVAEDDISG